MHRLPKYQDDGASPRSSRPPSINSDRVSTTGSTSTVTAVYAPNYFSPAAAYVAVAAASQIVTDHQNATLLDELTAEEADNVPAESARLSEEALALLNGFLDSILYSILATGRSQSLTAIRPAVQEILKTKLAREAIRAADEELSGLMAGEEDDEDIPNGQGDKWNLEAVFKRTRLRIMVYTRLGELEDDDEERYLSEVDSYAIPEEDDDDRDAGLVSWAAAIFLTSVIEYIAEQTLIVAGQAAFNRVRGKRKKNSLPDSDGQTDVEEPERVIVQEFDMEKVALNSSMGRLWRTWKKTHRPPITPITASARSSFYRSTSSNIGHRRYSTGNAHDAPSAAALEEVPEVEHSERDIASNIPLPIGDKDVEEIEVPGLAKTYEDVDGGDTPTQQVPAKKQRPMSWLAAPGSGRHLLRTRSNSMPSVKEIAARHASQISEETSGTPPFQTPAENFPQREDYMGEGNQVPNVEEEKPQNDEEKDYLDEEKDREDVSSVIAETGSLPGTASPPPATSRRSILRDRSPKPLQLGRDVLASARPTDTNRNMRHPIQTKQEIIQRKMASARAPLPEKDNGTARPSLAPGGDVTGLAKTSYNAQPTATSPPPVETADAAQKETQHAVATDDFDPYAEEPLTAKPFPTEPSKESSNEAPRTATREESRPNSPSSKLTPVMDLLKGTDSAGNRVSRALRSQTVSTQASQTIPQGPPSVSAFSSQTRESSLSRKSHESFRDHNRSRAATAEHGVDRAALQRVSSVSSGGTAGTSILHTSRGSESSIPVTNRRPTVSSRVSSDDRARDFDAAIAQADTVYYTLTPERMRQATREREEKERAAAEARAKYAAAATQVTVYPRVIHSSSGSPQLVQRSNTSSRGSLRSKQGKSSVSDDFSKESKAQRPTPINQIGNVYTRIKHMPREPRVQTDPTFDLRDFLVSTTPSGGNQNMTPIDTSFSRTTSTDGSNAPTPTGTKSFLSKSMSRSAKNSVSEGSSSSPIIGRESMGKRSKKSLEPRSPAGPTHIDNDLIDLIRQGPPGSDHRIPRTVAPFRDTMDSDQMEMFSSNHVTPSFHSQNTSTSRRGLLSYGSTVHPAYSSEPSILSGSMADQPTIVKNRPKKRVLDPYAIPDDDDLEEEFEDDEDDLTALPASSSGPPASTTPPPSTLRGVTTTVTSTASPSTNQSSGPPGSRPRAKTGTSDLADFLSSEPPPPHAAPSGPVQPFVLSESTLKAIKSGNSATAASANGIRSDSSHAKSVSKSSSGGLGRPPTAATTATAGNDKNGRLGTSATTSSFGGGAPTLRGGAVRQQPGARDARMGDREERGGLSEMADFLKNSGPPPMMVSDEKPMPFVKLGKDGNPIEPGTKEKKGFRFWKR